VILRCTAKVLHLLGIPAVSLTESAGLPTGDDWYMNLLWFSRQRCLLLTHAGTLFSVFVGPVRKADLLPIGPYVVNLVEAELRSGSLPPDVFGPLDPDAIRLAKTASRSVLGCMNDTALHCEYEIGEAGGLMRCDIRALNHRLRRTIHSPVGYAYPIDLAAQRLRGRR